MKENNIPFFYKYMSSTTAKIVLGNATLRWSIPSNLNDPFDAQLELSRFCEDFEQIIEQAIELWISREVMFKPLEDFVVDQKMREKYKDHRDVIAKLEEVERSSKQVEAMRKKAIVVKQNKLREFLEKRLRGVCKTLTEIENRASYTPVLCLSEVADSRLMWSHYADSYSGVVLQFASDPGSRNSYSDAQPIRYVDNPPDFSSRERLIEEFLLADTPTLDLRFDSIFPAVFLTKSSDWAYEKEWRILFLGEDVAKMFESTGKRFVDAPFDRDRLSGVIFGFRIEERDRQESIEKVGSGYSSVDFYQLKKPRSGFTLELEPIR